MVSDELFDQRLLGGLLWLYVLLAWAWAFAHVFPDRLSPSPTPPPPPPRHEAGDLSSPPFPLPTILALNVTRTL